MSDRDGSAEKEWRERNELFLAYMLDQADKHFGNKNRDKRNRKKAKRK